MLAQYLTAISQAPGTVALLCLLTGLLIYLASPGIRERVLELSRNHPQLLSVGAGMLLLFGILQIPAMHQGNDPVGEDVRVADSSPLPRNQILSPAQAALTAVTTYHNDKARTGQYLAETVLTPQNVNAGNFGKLYSFPVDGYIYAQPLYVPQVAIPGSGIHNVVIIATQHDSVYAFDADSSSSAPLWRVSFLDAGAGIQTLSPTDVNASDIVPEIGITSTPVIDLASNTLYVVAATKENGAFYHRLHALDVALGAEKFGGPRPIEAQFPGSAKESSDGMLTFDSRYQLQRSALLLDKRKLYIAFASYGDYGPYHGWVIVYDAVTLKQIGAWVTTPNSYQGGIWMAGSGISADENGSLYLSVANGLFSAYGATPGVDFSDSIVRLRRTSSGLSLTDFFTPFNQARMAEDDLDLGSAGVVLLPDQPGAYPHLAVTSAKNGHIYVLNRDDLGGYSIAGKRNPQVVQEIRGALRQQMGTPAYWNGNLYFGSGMSPMKDSIKCFRLSDGVLSRAPDSQTKAVYQLTRNTVSVSANGDRDGIVWAVQTDGYYAAGGHGPAILYAYDASNLARELYNSNQRFARDNPGPASKFTVPTVANGKVFVATANQLSVYGLLTNFAAGN